MTLRRIGYCCAIAVAGFGLVAADAFGQQKSLRDELVGVWIPTAHETTFHMWTAPSLQGVLRCFDQIACVHMSGLFARSHMNAGQDGLRDKSSKQNGDLIDGHWKMRNVSRSGSIDQAICSFLQVWHRLSTVAVECAPCLADL